MARGSRSTGIDEPSAAGARLTALRLEPPVAGWVPASDPGLDVGRESPVTPLGPDGAAEPAATPALEPARAAGPTPMPGTLLRGWLADRAPLWAQPAVERLGIGAVLAAIAVIIAVVIGVAALHHRGSAGYSSSYDSSAAAPIDGPSASPFPSAVADSPTDGASIVVDVGGRVRKPGLVTLPQGARVADAIAAAGGPMRHREIARLDLAARVTDGQLLLVGVGPSSAPGASTGSTTPGPAESSAAPVDLNSATIDELETLPRVGPVTAQKIIDWRTAHSGFTSVEQLQQISGIGPATYAELAPLVVP